MKKNESHISNKIRTFRFLANEMSQKELALMVGVTRQTINAIESCKYSPSLEVAFKIAAIFEVTVTDVFSYDPTDTPE
ncbi:MAG: transcriptional regulator [Alteromonadaceae bacterium]|nr:MAG: transcriptional regulator [Alteromonadaceae bacterium]